MSTHTLPTRILGLGWVDGRGGVGKKFEKGENGWSWGGGVRHFLIEVGCFETWRTGWKGVCVCVCERERRRKKEGRKGKADMLVSSNRYQSRIVFLLPYTPFNFSHARNISHGISLRLFFLILISYPNPFRINQTWGEKKTVCNLHHTPEIPSPSPPSIENLFILLFAKWLIWLERGRTDWLIGFSITGRDEVLGLARLIDNSVNGNRWMLVPPTPHPPPANAKTPTVL